MTYRIDVADILEWCEGYDGPKFHGAVMDTPYNLESIRKRFGKPDSAEAKGGVYNRSAKGFMNSDWDTDISFRPDTWYGIGKHLHPGGFILAASGSRSWHRMAVAMEDAGLIIHPTIFLYSFGSGFPKATRVKDNGSELADFDGYRYGLQALKPAAEPIICAQRPYEGRPVDNISATGAGVWNIDGGRIEAEGRPLRGNHGDRPEDTATSFDMGSGYAIGATDQGRWPSHLILQHNPDCRFTPDGWHCSAGCAVARLGEMSGERAAGGAKTGNEPSEPTEFVYNGGYNRVSWDSHNDQGTAARFFYQSHWSYEVYERLNHADSIFYTSKASVAEREAGLDELDAVTRNRVNKGGYERDPKWSPRQRKNNHPTVKAIALTKYLCQLLSPPAAYAPRRLLVPFAGVGSEMIGALLSGGWDEIQGVELGADFATIAQHRLAWWEQQIQWGCTDPEVILAAQNAKKAGSDNIGKQLALFAEAQP